MMAGSGMAGSGNGKGTVADDGRVRIFDTTLRDGEQAPGCSMTAAEKLTVAQQLARLRVDVIEAGYPAASDGDWAAVHQIAREVGGAGGPAICGLARATEQDIDRCWSAVEPAAIGRIHIFLATSDVHMKHKLGMTRRQVANAAAAAVSHARSLGADVEFSAEDSARSDPVFLYEVLAIALQCGATTLNVPDTVGYSTPDEYGALVAGVRANVPGIDGVTVSAHCHNDLGLAVANSLAGVRAGARQAECTINGIGERAGNAALEEVVMALHTRRPFFGLHTDIETRELARASRLVSKCTGIGVPPNKAIVGANAFAHEAGIHQDGVLKNRLTYEIMSAESVGWDGVCLVLGKHSGRHALRAKTEALGYELTDEELSMLFTRFKELADRKKLVEEGDIHALLLERTEVFGSTALY
jgi:2-isopropylmalate synthase